MDQDTPYLPSLLDAIHQIVFLIDDRSRIIEQNRPAAMWAKKFFNRDVATGDILTSFLPAEINKFISDAFRDKEPDSKNEMGILESAESEEHWFEYTFTPVPSGSEDCRMWVVITDVTERKFAVDEVFKRERRFSSLVRELSDIIIILEEDGTIRYTSDSIQKVLEYQLTELTGSMLRELVHPSETVKFENLFSMAKKQGDHTFTTELRIRNRSGHWVYLEVAGINLLADEHVQGFVLTSRDITYRKQIETILDKINRQQEMILESIGEGIYGIDKDGFVTFVNPAAAVMIGKNEKEIIGSSYREVIKYVDNRKKPFSGINDFISLTLMSGEYYRSSDVYLSRDNGTATPVEIIVNPIIDNNDIKGAVIAFRDISEQKKSEEDLKSAKEDAEKANQAKSDFLANISHELRTPLNSIMGFLELLGRTDLNPIQKDYVHVADDSSRNLMDIINDILDISKIEKGKLELQPSPFSPLNEFERTTEMFSTSAGDKNIDYQVFIDPGLPGKITGDSLRINQVLINLIGNAFKFTGPGGRIYVEITREKADPGKCRILFSISDTGIGISRSKLKHIFKPFSQADSTVSRKYGGTGLGLAISSRYISMMNGELRVVSEFGRGSRFYFELEFPAEDMKSWLPLFDVQHLAVLNYDDEITLESLFTYCEKLRIEYHILTDADELTTFETGFLLVNTPGMLPGDLKDLLAAHKKMRVILCTGYRKDLDIKQTMKYSDTLIIKPLTASKLINSLQMRKEPELTESVKQGTEPSKKYRVLVAEDNKNNQKLISLMLNEIGCTSDIAENGNDALNRFTYKRYNMILMDINMPICDGIEATKKIRTTEKAENREPVPIIALTAKAIKDEWESLSSAGFNDYLTKPVSISDLHRVTSRIQTSGRQGKGMNETAERLGISEKDLRDLILDFIKNAEEYRIHLAPAVSNMDFPEIEYYAHKMKGASSSYEFQDLTYYLELLENGARGREDLDYQHLLQKIDDEINRIHSLYSL